MAIAEAVAEFIALAIITILFDRWFNDRVAVLVLVLCLLVIGAVHRKWLIRLIHPVHQSQSSQAPSPPTNPSPNTPPSAPPTLAPKNTTNKTPSRRMPSAQPYAGPETKVPQQGPNKTGAPPQLAAVFENPTELSFYVVNSSDEVLEDVTWGMAAFRTSDLGFFGFATQSIGYVKPHMSSAIYIMDLENVAQTNDGTGGPLKAGDELTGSIAFDCPKCTIHTYIIHLVWKTEGWYLDYPQQAGYILPTDMSTGGRARYIESLKSLPEQKIQIMPLALPVAR
jgi:hypothetical protein